MVTGVGTAAVVALCLFFVAPIVASVELGIASVVLLAVAGVGYALVLPRVWVRGRLVGDEIVLRGVHPSFAAATAEITMRGPGAHASAVSAAG